MSHKIDPRYLKYVVMHAKMQGHFKAHSSGTTRLVNLRNKDVHDIIMKNLLRKQEAVDPEERKLRLRKILDKHKLLRVASGLASKAGAGRKSAHLWFKSQRALHIAKAGGITSGNPEMKAYFKHMTKVNKKNQKRNESVDPESRKLRLKNLLTYADKMRKDGRMARETLHQWQGSNPHQDASIFDHNKGLHTGNKIKIAQYAAWTKGDRARAIVQKYTGKDHKVGTYDWYGGTGKSNERHSWKRRRQAYEYLRRNRKPRVADDFDSGPNMSIYKSKKLGAAWLASRKHKVHLQKGGL